jgi:hypothetical protein
MKDERFAVLAAPIRQRVLLALLRCQPSELPLEVPDDFDGDRVEEDDFDDDGVEDVDFHARLYHMHLPKLASGEYVTWDVAAGTVTRGPRFGDVEPFLTDLVAV